MSTPEKNILIYLDHNILDGMSKGKFSLKPSSNVIWVYSNENLAEIKRSGDDRFLDVLNDIDARLIELTHDDQYRITGEAKIHPSLNAHDVYNNYLKAITESGNSADIFQGLIGRLFGADNKEQLLSLPDEFERQIEELLKPEGFYNNDIKEFVGNISSELKYFVEGDLQEIESLEQVRQAMGTHRGRANEAEKHQDPLTALWEKIKNDVPNELTADQFFGFDPMDKQGYESWPMYLGIVGCHTVLNHIGYRPDKGLSKLDDLHGIMSDGVHIAFGAYCQGLLTQDERLRAKAKVIYKYKNISTALLSLDKIKH